MRLFPFNVRGLGSTVKTKEVKDLIKNQKVQFCCLQETKLEVVDDGVGNAVWGSGRHQWITREAIGRILSIWDSEVFTCLSSWHMSGVVVVNGLWGQERVHCCIINVYASCVPYEKLELWDRIRSVIDQNTSSCICVAGDFNSIRRVSERDGSGSTLNSRDISSFDMFIRDSQLLNLPLHGRSYTWYRPNGKCKSRIDRIMVNSEWITRWPESRQKGLR